MLGPTPWLWLVFSPCELALCLRLPRWHRFPGALDRPEAFLYLLSQFEKKAPFCLF